uniref:Uncharacterized protein n=1 Tax=Caudovirales sp. ct0YK8 TaxID=2826764 RepID=A0A8S5NRM9_9CAUD|nr:MAG TPA: hypothetical protein [Caudovirales sp. ct0YK8]
MLHFSTAHLRVHLGVRCETLDFTGFIGVTKHLTPNF